MTQERLSVATPIEEVDADRRRPVLADMMADVDIALDEQRERQVLADTREKVHFIRQVGRQATTSMAFADTGENQIIVAENLVNNVERTFPEDSHEQHLELVREVIVLSADTIPEEVHTVIQERREADEMALIESARRHELDQEEITKLTGQMRSIRNELIKEFAGDPAAQLKILEILASNSEESRKSVERAITAERARRQRTLAVESVKRFFKEKPRELFSRKQSPPQAIES